MQFQTNKSQVLLRNIALLFICEHNQLMFFCWCLVFIHIGGGIHGLFGELLLTQSDEQGEHNNITTCVYNIESFECGLAQFI